jgi:hypothetical protein
MTEVTITTRRVWRIGGELRREDVHPQLMAEWAEARPTPLVRAT